MGFDDPRLEVLATALARVSADVRQLSGNVDRLLEILLNVLVAPINISPTARPGSACQRSPTSPHSLAMRSGSALSEQDLEAVAEAILQRDAKCIFVSTTHKSRSLRSREIRKFIPRLTTEELKAIISIFFGASGYEVYLHYPHAAMICGLRQNAVKELIDQGSVARKIYNENTKLEKHIYLAGMVALRKRQCGHRAGVRR